jgi:Xaa-Pro aminopeptidase
VKSAGRLAAVSAGLEDRKIDALLVTGLPNIRYLSGFTGDNAILLAARGRSILFTDPRFEIQAAQETSCPVKIAKGPLVVDVAAAIKRLGLKRIGFEPARITVQVLKGLSGRLPMRAAMHETDGWIEQLRMVKSEEEIARIRRSVIVNSQAFEQAARRVRVGMSEADLAAELEYRMRRLGAEKPSFETIVAGGARSALPHAQPTSAKLAGGQLIVVDMGATVDGYCSDMTRMLFLGEPGPKVKRTYRAVLEAQLAGVDAVRDGASTSKVDGAARRVLRGYGLDRAFVHSTGHGLGLEIHEPPRIGRKDKSRLQEGMAVTIEPGVYLEGFGGIRIEDTVVVTRSGCEVLTPTPKELRVL